MANIQNAQGEPNNAYILNQANLNQVIHPDQHHKNLLHVKPICHQICRAITLVGLIQQNTNPHRFHGKFLIVVVKSFMATGYVLNTVIAAIESVGAFAFASIALSLHALTKGRFLMLQKVTLKLCAYYINTLLIAGVQIACLKKGIFSRHHTVNALGNHAVHGASALIAQFIGYGFDRWAGRNPANENQIPPATIRAIRILIELAPNLFQDTTTAAVRDFSVHIRDNQHRPDMQAFLQAYPNHAQILGRFTFRRFRQDIPYRREFINLFTSYFVQSGMLNNFAVRVGVRNNAGAEDIHMFGANRAEEDKKYQNSLLDLISASVIELHDNEALVQYLNKYPKEEQNAVENGREELTAFDATASIKLANYVQLKEIEKEISCPKAFLAHELHPYNHRQEKLLAAKTDLDKLSAAEKEILVKKLLKGGDFDVDKQGLQKDRAELIQKLFNNIGLLAGELHQGRLLSDMFVDFSQMQQGNFNGAYGAVSLFGKAWEKGVKEIADRSKPKDEEQKPVVEDKAQPKAQA